MHSILQKGKERKTDNKNWNKGTALTEYIQCLSLQWQDSPSAEEQCCHSVQSNPNTVSPNTATP